MLACVPLNSSVYKGISFRSGSDRHRRDEGGAGAGRYGPLARAAARPSASRRIPSAISQRSPTSCARCAQNPKLGSRPWRGLGVSGPVRSIPRAAICSIRRNLPGWDRCRCGVCSRIGSVCRLRRERRECAALAEWRFGAARATSTSHSSRCRRESAPGSCSAASSTPAKHGAAGEVGHAPVVWGRRGVRVRRAAASSLRSAEAPGPALARTTPAQVASQQRSRARTSVRGRGRGGGGARGRRLRARRARPLQRYLALGLTTLVFTLAPEVVILGTIPSGRRRRAVPRARARAGARARLADAGRELKIGASGLWAAAAVLAGNLRRDRGAARAERASGTRRATPRSIRAGARSPLRARDAAGVVRVLCDQRADRLADPDSRARASACYAGSSGSSP